MSAQVDTVSRMSPRTITALVIPPGEMTAYLRDITPDLATLQGLVGGWVEQIRLSEDAVAYLHEEGKYEGLPMNAAANRLVVLAETGLAASDYIVGPLVVTGLFDESGGDDGQDHDVPASVLDLCARAGVQVQTPSKEA